MAPDSRMAVARAGERGEGNCCPVGTEASISQMKCSGDTSRKANTHASLSCARGKDTDGKREGTCFLPR